MSRRSVKWPPTLKPVSMLFREFAGSTPIVDGMDIDYPGFGRIVVEGRTFDHDIVIEGNDVRPREKGPSRSLKSEYGHTPLSSEESLPWSRGRLIIGSGYSGRLPVLEEVLELGQSRGVEVTVMPTAEACKLLVQIDQEEVAAVLHVTC